MVSRAAFADHGVDAALGERGPELVGVVAAVGPELAGSQPAGEEFVDQRQQVSALVLVAGGEPDRERDTVSVDG